MSYIFGDENDPAKVHRIPLTKDPKTFKFESRFVDPWRQFFVPRARGALDGVNLISTYATINTHTLMACCEKYGALSFALNDCKSLLNDAAGFFFIPNEQIYTFLDFDVGKISEFMEMWGQMDETELPRRIVKICGEALEICLKNKEIG